MTIKELEEKLSKLKLPYRNYNLYADYLDDGICMKKSEGTWSVYYCERGKKNSIGLFDSENDACEFVFCKYKKISDENRWF